MATTNPYAPLIREAKLYLDAQKPLPFTLGQDLINALNNTLTLHALTRDLNLPVSDPAVSSLYGVPAE